MSSQPNQSTSGFTLGVILGAALGTAAVVLQQSPEGREIKDKLIKKIKESADDFREHHPEASTKFDQLLQQALQEAHKATNSLKKGTPTKSTSSSKRTFVRKGKPL